jgi:outer membrane protein assembly factor BamB
MTLLRHCWFVMLLLAATLPSAVHGAPQLGVKWFTKLPAVFGADGHPTLFNNSLVVGTTSSGAVVQLSAATGSQMRSESSGCIQIGSGPKYDAATGLVVVSCPDMSIRALDFVSGIEKWSFPTSAGSFEPGRLTVQGGSVYFGDGWGTQYSIELASGRQRWAFADPIPNGCYTGVVVVDGIAVFGCDDKASTGQGLVVGVNDTTGAVVWQTPTGGTMRSRPVSSGGLVYIGCGSGFAGFCRNVYAVNPKNGSYVWTFKTGSYVVASPVVYNGMVYVGSNDATFYALDALTGALQWSSKSLSGQGFVAGAAVMNGIVAFSDVSGRHVTFADWLSGAVISRVALGNSSGVVNAALTSAHDTFFALSDNVGVFGLALLSQG